MIVCLLYTSCPCLPIHQTEREVTVAAHLTNNADGSTRYVDSTTASPSNDVSPSLGSVFVATPSSKPIPKGNVSVPSDGFGAIICPDSKTFAAYDDAAMKWFVSSSGPNGSTPKSSVIESVEGLAKSNGCHYIGPEMCIRDSVTTAVFSYIPECFHNSTQAQSNLTEAGQQSCLQSFDPQLQTSRFLRTAACPG